MTAWRRHAEARATCMSTEGSAAALLGLLQLYSLLSGQYKAIQAKNSTPGPQVAVHHGHTPSPLFLATMRATKEKCQYVDLILEPTYDAVVLKPTR